MSHSTHLAHSVWYNGTTNFQRPQADGMMLRNVNNWSKCSYIIFTGTATSEFYKCTFKRVHVHRRWNLNFDVHRGIRLTVTDVLKQEYIIPISRYVPAVQSPLITAIEVCSRNPPCNMAKMGRRFMVWPWIIFALVQTCGMGGWWKRWTDIGGKYLILAPARWGSGVSGYHSFIVMNSWK